MLNYPSLKGQFVIALSLAAALWMVPASASEGGAANEATTARVVQAAAIVADTGETPRRAYAANADVIRKSVAEKSRHVRHRWTSSNVRRAASYYQHRIREAVSRPACSGIWCGRAFVLLLGIGF